MKKTIVALLFVGVAFATTILPARAQGDEQALATIPVRFIVGSKVLPAGTYIIEPRRGDWTVLQVTSVDHKWQASLPVTQGGPSPTITPKVKVNFAQYFGEYFLNEVEFPGLNSREAHVTKADAERILAKLNLTPGERADFAK